MSSHNLTNELLEKVRASIHAAVASGRTFLSEVIKLGVCAGSGGSGTLLTLAVLITIIAGNPSPTPTPLPF